MPYPYSTQADTRQLRRSFILAVSFTAMLWLVKLTEIALDLKLGHYGVFPRHLSGLAGILWTPWIHGSFSHLVANSGAIIILGTVLLYGYPKSAKIVIPSIYLGAGFGVWLMGRSVYHIGASGLTFGMMFFVFTIGVLRWDRRAIALALMVFLLYGSMVWGIFPGKPGISFESHFFGAATGVLLAFLLKHNDPPPPEKRYSWENEYDPEGMTGQSKDFHSD